MVIGQVTWVGVSSLAGGKSVQFSLSTPDEPILFWLVSPFVALVLHAAVFFIAMHGSLVPLRVLDLAVVGGIFGLLYLHSGELGLGIGAHFGAFYAGTVVFAVFQVTGTVSGVIGTIDQYGFPKMVMAYLVVLAWLTWRRGHVPIRDSLACCRSR